MSKPRILTKDMDFEVVLARLTAALRQKDNGWTDVLPTAIGQHVQDVLSAIFTTTQWSVMMAARESTLPTARTEHAVVSHARGRGIHISRRKPAAVQVRLQSSAPGFVQVSPYSQWSIGGMQYFNRQEIAFNADEGTKDFTLYEGTVTITDVIATGGPLQRYFVGVPDFSLSDEDIWCYVNDDVRDKYVRSLQGPWFFKEGEQVFFENTFGDGQVEVRFGDGVFGKVPETGDKLSFVYVITNGTLGNNTAINLGVSTSATEFITGSTISAMVGGTDQRPIDFYRIYGPALYSDRRGAVRREGYTAAALEFGGVLDAYMAGQAETFPDDPRFSKVVLYTLLTDPDNPFGDSDHDRFIAYMSGATDAEQGGGWGMWYVRRDPEPIVVRPKIVAYYWPDEDAEAAKTNIVATVRDFFIPRAGSLGRSLMPGDLAEPMMQMDAIDTVNVLDPVGAVYAAPYNFLRLDPAFSDADVTMLKSTRRRLG